MLKNNSRNYSEKNKRRVRRLRSDMSLSKTFLWAAPRKRQPGFLFRRQHPVGPCVLEFNSPEAMLRIEVDGEKHLERKEQDLARDDFLLGQGIFTSRIPSWDLHDPHGLKSGRWVR
ncbi:MAG TPA: DUF559 domain-containing protein, partial [Fimbriimonas sp.]